MNLEQLTTFHYVALTKSFSQAAEVLFISQPAVSARIQSLEKEIGYPLFERNERTITLTKEGDTFLPYAQKGLESIQDGLRMVHQTNKMMKGDLNIATVFTMANYTLPTILKKFHESYPDIKINISTGHSRSVLNMVLNHEATVGIARSITHNDINTIHLLTDEMVLAIYPGHNFTQKQHISIKDIDYEPLILFNRGSIDRELINNAFNKLQIKPNVVMETDSILLVKKMIKRKIGIGLIPRIPILNDVEANTLHIKKINDLHQIDSPFQIIHLKDNKVDPVSQLFIDFIIENTKDSYEHQF